jgi:hypothetical protein
MRTTRQSPGGCAAVGAQLGLVIMTMLSMIGDHSKRRCEPTRRSMAQMQEDGMTAYGTSLSFAYWGQSGWMMLLSGAFGVLAGLLILFGLPIISRWALGFLFGVDLLSHCIAWLVYALRSVRATA